MPDRLRALPDGAELARPRLTDLRSAQKALARAMLEEQLQEAIFAVRHGLWIFHPRKGRTNKGHRTPVAADGKGYLDLTIVGSTLAIVELKKQNGSLEPEQREWMARLRSAGIYTDVWKPADWYSGWITACLEAMRRSGNPQNE